MRDKFSQREVFTAIAGAIAEWLFAMLPLLVVAIVMTHIGKSSVVLESAEWAFGASILAGQSLVRFVAGVVGANRLSLERVLLGVSVVLVFVVVPANIILVLVIMAEEREQHVSSLLAASQAGLFIVASAIFVLVAASAHLWTRRDHEARPGRTKADNSR